MIEVFVVRQFYEDCNDNSYIGAYSDFWKAVAGAKADQEENYGDEPEYGFKILEPLSMGGLTGTQVWCEVTWEGKGHGIYYTVDRMELK